MKKVKINLSGFSAAETAKWTHKLKALAWDDYDVTGHPETVILFWNHPESLESVYPELADRLTYL